MSSFTPKFRFQHWLPRKLKVEAIVFYPFVLFSRPRELVSNAIICHEMIHVRQVRRLGWMRFYTQYLWEYLSGRSKGRSKLEAYRSISFEREAHQLASLDELDETEKQEAGLA